MKGEYFQENFFSWELPFTLHQEKVIRARKGLGAIHLGPRRDPVKAVSRESEVAGSLGEPCGLPPVREGHWDCGLPWSAQRRQESLFRHGSPSLLPTPEDLAAQRLLPQPPSRKGRCDSPLLLRWIPSHGKPPTALGPQ